MMPNREKGKTMELGNMKGIKLATKEDKEGKTTFSIVLEVEPKSKEVVELIQHVSKGETLVVNLEVLQPSLFGGKGGDEEQKLIVTKARITTP